MWWFQVVQSSYSKIGKVLKVGFCCCYLKCVNEIRIVLNVLVFAFAENYAVLFTARAIQGIGSSGTSVSGKIRPLNIRPCKLGNWQL